MFMYDRFTFLFSDSDDIFTFVVPKGIQAGKDLTALLTVMGTKTHDVALEVTKKSDPAAVLHSSSHTVSDSGKVH